MTRTMPRIVPLSSHCFTNGDPVRVAAHNLLGRVCGRTIETSDREPVLDVLDAAGKVHGQIPAHLAEPIEERDCPVPPFGRSLSLAPPRPPVLIVDDPPDADWWLRRLFPRGNGKAPGP